MNAYIYTSMCAFCVGDEPYPPLITCVYLHTQPMRKLVTEGDPRPGVTSEEVFFKVVGPYWFLQVASKVVMN